MPAPPDPFHILRAHSAPLSCIAFNPSNTLLYSGDQDGWVSITDVRTRRSVLFWKAHEGGVQGVAEWDGRLISHGRDNLIHIYERIPLIRRAGQLGTRAISGPSGTAPADTSPAIWKSFTVNSLNFCRFDILPIPWAHDDLASSSSRKEAEGLLAVPNLLDAELADIYHLPSMRRLHAAVNTPATGKGKAKATGGSKDAERSGLIMSIHLRFLLSAPSPKQNEPEASESHSDPRRLVVVMGYEDGRVDMWGIKEDEEAVPNQAAELPWRKFTDGSGQVGKRVWELLWSGKGHNEAVMAMCVSRDGLTAYTVSADHQLVKYKIGEALADPSAPDLIIRHSTSQIGNASIVLSPTEEIVAIGGWDGKIRLFSTSSGKPLGTLGYHRETVQCLAFPQSPTAGDEQEREATAVTPSTIELGEEDDGDDSDTSTEGGLTRGSGGVARWLVSGGKDRRIALWELMDFAVPAR